jgi:hypothetical protein
VNPMMTLRPLLIIALGLGSMAAAEQGAAPSPIVLATQSFGEGVRDIPIPIAPGRQVRSGRQVARLDFAPPAAGFILLAPHSELHLTQIEEAGQPSLLISIDAGRIEVSLDQRGSYQDVHVQGGFIDVRVTGTLFVVERQAHDTDYVALVHGKVSVRLRSDVTTAVAAGARDHVELDDHQGISGGANGLSGTTDSLGSRPQVLAASSVHDQGTAQGGNWDEDDALHLIENGGQGGGHLSGLHDIDASIQGTISQQVSDTIAHNIETQITTEVVNQTLGGGPIFGSPPPHP